MRRPGLDTRLRQHVRLAGLAAGSALALTLGGGSLQAAAGDSQGGFGRAVTPIQHVIVIIGENHTFDNVFATYQPGGGQHIQNLLSEGIINADGSPGPNVRVAAQHTASDTNTYRIDPTTTGTYATLPQPSTTSVSPACDGGQARNTPDARFSATMPNAPYQLTKGVPYAFTAAGCPEPGAWVGDALHRFYQMWQQNAGNEHDQVVWTANTAGDDNGAIPPAPIFQGGVGMGFYNVQDGDAPLLNTLANSFAISDNYHQDQMGGTGVDHFALGTGDFPFFNDGNGNAQIPPANQIENPNPLPGTNNAFVQDGYSGGSYTNCSATNAPGVASIMSYVRSQVTRPIVDAACAPGHYYLLNNYNPAYNADGTLVDTTQFPFTISPQTVPTIADELSARGVSWGYFGQGLSDTDQQLPGYCNICNPFQYAKSIMTTPLRNNIKGFQAFEAEAKAGTLPAVSFVKPDGLFDGHPASSTLAAFEAFTRQTINDVLSNPREWASTAIFDTVDEGGGYYDSGYIQPISFFGDGPRIPLITVSPWARQGFVDHTYDDHVSILKFIEANWRLRPLSNRSEDNLPNPVTRRSNPYVPVNGPALGNLMDMFDFRAEPHMAAPRMPVLPSVNPLQ